MPEVLKAVFEELLVDQPAGRASEVRAIQNDLFVGIDRVESLFQTLEMDRTAVWTFRDG
jgi:hypothetical protein